MPLPGHSVPFISLGAFILIFGFFAFNGGSQGRISSAGDGSVVALAITNTLLGCIGGGLALCWRCSACVQVFETADPGQYEGFAIALIVHAAEPVKRLA